LDLSAAGLVAAALPVVPLAVAASAALVLVLVPAVLPVQPRFALPLAAI
jgi:hypothetical protein